MISYDTARQIAAEAHHGKTEKDGGPYIRHLERVADLVPDDYRPLALLHDLVEDTDSDLFELDLQNTIEGGTRDNDLIEDILRLSRRDGETYREFITRVCNGSDRALTVKLCDVIDHLRPGYEKVLGPSHIDRYRRALDVLVNEFDRRDLKYTMRYTMRMVHALVTIRAGIEPEGTCT